MKNLLFILIFVSVPIFGQKYYTKTGITEFKASVDTFEPIKAINNSTSVILNVTTGDIASLLFVKAFNFRVGLMQEHFNENYMDSDKFPKATFRGAFEKFDFSKFSESTTYPLKGTLTIRGVEKNIETTATLSKKGNHIMMQATFIVRPEDFQIKIPKIVRNKIAKTVNIYLDYVLVEKK